uniref:Polynucleotide 5'-hydroxyl-kinase NOL9 n=1 Tax=Hucho hucho TaxID=62062 RepID=A0A4W5MJX5_9TELE
MSFSCFRGKCLLSCLYGRLEVYGFTIEEGQQSYSRFSPSSHCPLTITALGDSPNPSKTKNFKCCSLFFVFCLETRKRLFSEVDSDSSVILLVPLDTPLTRFLTSFPDLKELFGLSTVELVLNWPTWLNKGEVKNHDPTAETAGGMLMSQTYREALSSVLDGFPVILVCSAKNVGKSTFNRHLINTLLNHTASVEYLECDLGQTEFTPSGCLSLSTVREPLLGMYCTAFLLHLFYGQSSCETDLDRYLEEMPIVINTMGWVKGHQLQSPEPGSVRPLHGFTPYQVPHSAVAVGVTHCEVAPTHVLYAANASLVGLCFLNEKVSGRGGPVLFSQTPVCPCVGFGVLWGVDMAHGLYFLVTPVSPSVIRQVNCLLLGAVTLPNILLTGQPPYVTMDYNFELTGAGKIHVFKGLARPVIFISSE